MVALLVAVSFAPRLNVYSTVATLGQRANAAWLGNCLRKCK